VHWLFADEYTNHLTRERAYTVVTRAKSSLTVYYERELPDYIAGAIPPAARGLFDDDE
jgi:ATP-dependent exoDNAse (exonuclease V) alpha subunit